MQKADTKPLSCFFSKNIPPLNVASLLSMQTHLTPICEFYWHNLTLLI